MAESVTTRKRREDLCKAGSGDITLPTITQMALGTGGLDAAGAEIKPTGEEVSLRNEVLRKEVDGHTYPETTKCRYELHLDKPTLAGEKITEAGLYDSNGNLICYKTFGVMTKADDMEMTFFISENF